MAVLQQAGAGLAATQLQLQLCNTIEVAIGTGVAGSRSCEAVLRYGEMVACARVSLLSALEFKERSIHKKSTSCAQCTTVSLLCEAQSLDSA